MWPVRSRISALRSTSSSSNRVRIRMPANQAPMILALQQGNKSNNPCNQYKTFYINDTYGSGFGPQHPDFQQTVNDACVAVDPEQSAQLFGQIQKQIYDEAVEIQLYRQENIWAVRKRVSGFQAFAPDATRVWEGLSVSA